VHQPAQPTNWSQSNEVEALGKYGKKKTTQKYDARVDKKKRKRKGRK
jgi:hypothetical protein